MGGKGLCPLEIVFLPSSVSFLFHFLRLCAPQPPARLRSLLASPLPPDSFLAPGLSRAAPEAGQILPITIQFF